MYSSWKVTAANSLLLILIALAFAVHAQPSVPGQKKVTITFHKLTLEDALEQISNKTGVDFVYSANLIRTNSLVSFTAVQQPMENILLSLGQQLNLSFKWFGNHIVVKSSIISLPKPSLIASQFHQIVSTKKIEQNEDPSEEKIDSSCYRSFNPRPHFVTPRTVPFSSLSNEEKWNVREKLDSLIVSSLLNRQEEKFRQPKPSKWFASIGLMANDFTYGGLEIRAGTNSIHGIVNASMVNNELTRIGYGIGTNIPTASKKFSWNLSYTLAKVKKQEDLVFNNNVRTVRFIGNHVAVNDYVITRVFDDAFQLRSTHHQVRLIRQYNITPALTIQLGPTMNILNTRYKIGDSDRSVYENFNVAENIISSNTIIPPYTIFSYYSMDGYTNTKFWFGLEAGLAYRINFKSLK